MGFRQKNERKHEWDRFCRANRELMLEAGLPFGIIESYDAFLYFLDHRYVGFGPGNTVVATGPGATYFHVDDLPAEQLARLRELMERYLAAGFEGPSRVPGFTHEEAAALRRKYPDSYRWARRSFIEGEE